MERVLYVYCWEVNSHYIQSEQCPYLYHMSIYLLPKTIVKEMDKVRRTFFWQGGHAKRKYHLVKWTKYARVRKKGGVWESRTSEK